MFHSKYVIFTTFWWFFATTADIVRNEDICGPHNGRRLYLELGEKGILYAKNVTFDRDSLRQLVSRLYTTINSSHHQCNLELVTCPSCMIVITFKNIALPYHCGDGVVMDSQCRCDYVWLSEPPYEEVSGSPFCGVYAPISYRSSTRALSITLFYSQFYKHAFTIEYMAEYWEVEPGDHKWHMNKENYYFPKIDRYPDLKTITLVFIASSLGLIILISTLIILLYRIGARARQQRELQSRLETISELLDGVRIDEISIPDDPPGYEAPPDYDEVAKITLSKKA
ncbi:uncharacterized protein LOC105202597 isoform X2 [Solenopsis invicta]|uniref:uncharacterized protein LOC105202597 isoform X2 n=1 Tax=Solenopsis invicta TaxID=13686 RepID=UPI00193E53C9|nr:uncharacterized protein LOC105202597 isoform X2 [Solenopsis invicta]